METSQGLRFYPQEPRAEQFNPIDIAHALAHSCRYGGHTKRFYSVAEHVCVLCDYVAESGGDAQACWDILHHDSAEAYLCDIPRPVKKMIPDYYVLEERVEKALFHWLGVRYPFTGGVKYLDDAILQDERQQCMRPSPNIWYNQDRKPLGVRLWWLLGRSSWWCKREFLRRHDKLCDELGKPHLKSKNFVKTNPLTDDLDAL